MYSLTATKPTVFDTIKDENQDSELKQFTVGDMVTCSNDEYLKLDRAGFVVGTATEVNGCWEATYIGD